MSDIIGSVFLIALFSFLLYLFNVTTKSRNVITFAKKAKDLLSDKKLDEMTKEKLMQEYSIKLFGLFGIISIFSILSLAVPVVILWILDKFHVVSLSNILRLIQQWEFITIALVFGIVIYLLYRWCRK